MDLNVFFSGFGIHSLFILMKIYTSREIIVYLLSSEMYKKPKLMSPQNLSPINL